VILPSAPAHPTPAAGAGLAQAGGYRVRGRTIDPRSGKMREINWALPDLSKARDACAWLQDELEKIRSGVVAEQPSLAPQFHAYAADVFKRKLDLGKIRSAAGRSKWSNVVEKHLVPAFGDRFVDQLRPGDIKGWETILPPSPKHT
jgi:hypothetical protein